MENLTFAQNIAYLLVSLLVAVSTWYLRQRVGAEKIHKIKLELELKRDLAIVAVKYTEQFWRNAKGDEKYVKASEWLAYALRNRGINVDPSDIRALIEWSLREIKDQLGEEWADIEGATPKKVAEK